MPTAPLSHSQLQRQRHQPEMDRLYDQDRGCAAARGYDSRWTRLRAWFLAQHPLCNRCGDPANEVHHKHELRQGGARLDPDNLEALCKSCHSKETRRQHGAFGYVKG